jgi:hypothetical protein
MEIGQIKILSFFFVQILLKNYTFIIFYSTFQQRRDVRWDPLQPKRACKPNSLENSNIEKLWALNQQLSKILLVLVVVVPYAWFTTPMTF